MTADIIHGSGIVAVVVAALMLVVARRRLRLHGQRLLDFWDLAGFILNVVVFILIGTSLPIGDVFALGGSIIVGFVLLTALRFATVYPLLIISDWRARRLPWRTRPIVVWGGMRGALSIALALSIQAHSGVAQSVVTIAYGIVILSLLLQGSTVRPLVFLTRATPQQAESPHG